MNKPNDDDFKLWLSRSKVKKLVYHATVHVFDTFDTSKGDLGSHFGSIDQANNVAKYRLENHNIGEPFIIPVWIQLNNPLRLIDVGSFHADGIAKQLEKKGLLPKGEGTRITKEIDQNWRARKTYDPICLQAIKDAGYDGVVYANTAEHEGAGDSYIVFEPEQVVFAITNQYNENRAELVARRKFR